jgi:hypothetical protein
MCRSGFCVAFFHGEPDWIKGEYTSTAATRITLDGNAKLNQGYLSNLWMNRYKRHRYPSEIISYSVWLYYRFNPGHRDIENLLAKRGVIVSRDATAQRLNASSSVYCKVMAVDPGTS